MCPVYLNSFVLAATRVGIFGCRYSKTRCGLLPSWARAELAPRRFPTTSSKTQSMNGHRHATMEQLLITICGLTSNQNESKAAMTNKRCSHERGRPKARNTATEPTTAAAVVSQPLLFAVCGSCCVIVDSVGHNRLLLVLTFLLLPAANPTIFQLHPA